MFSKLSKSTTLSNLKTNITLTAFYYLLPYTLDMRLRKDSKDLLQTHPIDSISQTYETMRSSNKSLESLKVTNFDDYY